MSSPFPWWAGGKGPWDRKVSHPRILEFPEVVTLSAIPWDYRRKRALKGPLANPYRTAATGRDFEESGMAFVRNKCLEKEGAARHVEGG